MGSSARCNSKLYHLNFMLQRQADLKSIQYGVFVGKLVNKDSNTEIPSSPFQKSKFIPNRNYLLFTSTLEPNASARKTTKGAQFTLIPFLIGPDSLLEQTSVQMQRKLTLSALYEFADHLVSQPQRMAASTGRTAATQITSECLLRAGHLSERS